MADSCFDMCTLFWHHDYFRAPHVIRLSHFDPIRDFLNQESD